MAEIRLLRKLLSEGHLNVPDRERVRGERVPLSAVIEAAAQVLAQDGSLPPSWSEQDDFDGALLLKTGDAYKLIECHEIGVGRYGEKRVTRYRELTAAVRRWLQVQYKGVIDGIAIEWDA